MLAGVGCVESSDRAAPVPVESCDDREAARLAAVVAEHRASRRLVGAALRAVVVEALTYASGRDPVDRVRVHVVDRYRCTAAEAVACMATLALADWRAIYAERARWQTAERLPSSVPAVVLGDVGATPGGRLLLARLDDRARECAGDIPAVPGRGNGRPSADRVVYLTDAAARCRYDGGSYSTWVRWCSARGIGRASASRWWARVA